jgi:hypothetical protein
MDEPGKTASWKAWLMVAATGMVTSAGGYVSSHWGGTTADQLTAAETRLGVKIDNVKWDVAKGADDMKKYVDAKVSASEERIIAAQPKKKKRSNGDQ